MNIFSLDYFLVAILALIGIAGSVLHAKLYHSLYNSLAARDKIEPAYKPDWRSKLGALGCMGLIARLKRELGVENINAEEMHLLQRSSISFYVATFSAFAAICLLYRLA